MSRGHGWIQKKILDSLEVGAIAHLLDLTFHIYNTDNPSKAQYNAVSRAVIKLEKEGYLANYIFKWRTPLPSLTPKELMEFEDSKPEFMNFIRDTDPDFYEKIREDKYKFKKKVDIYGLNKIKCSHKTYDGRNHHPKWSKRVIRIR